jgi:2-C-methyl-D-erythritol 4-phosphate cytidylyltransferase
MSVAAVIVAAGSGIRLAAGMPKALVRLHGRSLLDWTLEAFLSHPDIDSIVVVAPAAAVAEIERAAAGRVTVVAGGASRQHSVRCGLDALDARVKLVLVHDAARPLIPQVVISAVVQALRGGAEAVIPVLPITDTIKRVDAGGHVQGTVERNDLRVVQTPQGFCRDVLVAAHQAAMDSAWTEASDDAGLVEAAGGAVLTVPGAELSFKITTSYDLRLAHWLAPVDSGSL